MENRLRIRTRNGEYSALLDGSDISLAIMFELPFKTRINMISGLIYFEMDIDAIESGKPTNEFSVGDIAWWPGTGALAIFYGQTALSKGGKNPVTYHKMIKIGRVESDCSGLENAGDRQTIELLRPEL